MNSYDRLKNKLELGKHTNIKYIESNDIDKLDEISVNTNLSKTERIIDFIERVKNPYIFMIDGGIVKFEYAEKGLNVNECLENLINTKIKNEKI